MSPMTPSHRTAPDSTTEISIMPKRLAGLAALISATAILLALPSLASAESPWWQILDGARPTKMWEPGSASEVQKIEINELFGGFIFAHKIEVGGEVVGCLGGENESFKSADEFCEEATPYGADETAAELEATLEAAYGGDVEVSGGPVGEGASFEVTTPGRWVEPLKLTPVEFFGIQLGKAKTSVLSEDSGHLVVTVTNLGDAPLDATGTPVTIVDKLPEGVTAWGAQAFAGIQGKAGPVDCAIEAPDEVICSFEDELSSFEGIEIEVFTVLTGSPPDAAAPGAEAGQITVSGGNAPSATGTQQIEVSPDPTPFGIERFSAVAEEEGGAGARQAGGHPFQYTTTLQLNSGRLLDRKSGGDGVEQPGVPRNLDFPLPAGLVGNAKAVQQCDLATFFRMVTFVNYCPDESVIGAASVTIDVPGLFGLVRVAVPVFNLPPAHGEPARFGLMPLGVPVMIDTSVDPDHEYRITASVSNTTEIAQFLSSTVSFWGAPGDPRHDSSRNWACVYHGQLPDDFPPCQRPANLSEDAFLRMPVSCNGPLSFGMSIEPWNVPLGSVIDSTSSTSEPLLGCNKVPFDPAISAAPTSKLAEGSSGLDFKLNMPNANLLNKDGIAEAQPKKVEVTLPEGMTLNPSAAEGLATCSPAQYASERFDSKPGDGCPEAAKIGNVAIKTPLVEGDVNGALYLASSRDNPFNSLIALYIVARLPERGVLIKLAGKVDTDKQTGQIVTTFDDAPQLPFESFDLHFREGGRAPLVTPPACGDYDVVAKFTPWSAQDPDNPAPSEVVTRKSTFTVQRGVDGGACPSGGIPPFKPGFEAGSINNDAGAFSPFDMRLTRGDGEQDMTKFSTVLPPGVLGSLAGVSKCSDAAIAAAKAKSGKEELASPSCPAGSEIGHTTVGAGVGSILTYIAGKVYLGGPYKGDPLSVIAITPAVAGPFDVGTVVVQEALTLNPRTAEVEVDGAASDPIPHILEGIPVKVRDLRVYVDRPNFILNPTSCEESKTEATLFGGYLDVFSSADDVPVALSDRYQAANCANLGFKPRLNLKLKGGTRRGAHPGLKATYTPHKGDANLKGLVVRLPSSAFLDQAHIRTICTRVQFAAKACPKAAQYGYIKAWTPLLDETLQGPVYLRSSNHKLPDLVFDLHGLVDVEVATRIDSVHGGIRATVEDAPDAPLTKVLLRMQGAKKGLIVNSRNLCGGTNRANVQFIGHNGKELSAKPVMAPGCGGKRKHKRAHH